MKRFLGFVVEVLILSLLCGCSGGQSIPDVIGNLITTGTTNGIRVPSVGQWVANGGIENQPQGNVINFNCCQDAQMSGYYYTKLPATPQVGQTVTLTYTLTGNNPVFSQVPASGGNSQTDIGPPTNSLLIWQANDNESCSGDYNFYRLFPRSQYKLNLTLGTHSISVPLTGANWQGCYPGQVVTDARLQQALNNLLGIGFTFGGQYFDGHGIYLSSGTATFVINSFTVK